MLINQYEEMVTDHLIDFESVLFSILGWTYHSC